LPLPCPFPVPTDLYLHPRRCSSKLRIEFLHRSAHAVRISLISAHADPAPRRSLVLRHALGWAADAHCGAHRCKVERLG
jgi:hypothetical protein